MGIGTVTMLNPSVNSGTAVILGAVSVNYAWKCLTNSTPIPGKYAIVETNVGGFENPRITIRGTIDAGDIQSNYITQSLLIDFAKLNFVGTTATAIKLVVKAGADGSTGLYLRNSTDTQNYLYVIIENFNISLDTGSVDERRWNFTIQCVETSAT